ncbi:MAG: 30S ribosomal protein S12 methylthiotransferase RimO [Coriobacteriia bacterium]
MENPPAIAFVTIGCPKNEVDSDRMAALVEASPYRVVDDPADADAVVLNTCAFIQTATEESIATALELAGEWVPAGDGRKLIVAGCMPSRYGADLAEAMPEADAFLPVAEEDQLPDVLEALFGVPFGVRVEAPTRTAGTHTAYLKVSEGCDRTCAYCTIPAIRGRFISAPLDGILAEARFLIDTGARELVLVGQDIASYGHDLAERADLATLVERLDALEGDFRIRLMYLQPDGVTNRLLSAMADARKVCHYLDIPLQHASASILEAMGRTGDAARFHDLLDRVRAALPDVTLRTTVMAGFPGETEGDAATLERFIEAAAFDFVGVFAFSPEEGTRAAAMPGQLPDDVRAERAQRLRDIADVVGFARAAALVGSVRRVLVEGDDEDDLVGRTCGQAPDVDGLTVIDGSAAVGTLVDVRIIDAAGYDLIGELS